MDPDCNLPALVNTDLPPASLEALTILSGKRELVAVAADEVVHVERLHVPSFHTYHPDTPTLPWIAGAGVHRPTLLEARRRWLAAAGAEPGDRRVLLLRESGVRGLVNAERLARIASRRGFEPVDPGKLSFVEQVRLIHGSAIISGVGGAALANLLFCRPGAKVLGLVSEQLADFTMQAHLADLAGAEFTYVTGPSGSKASSATHHRDHLHSDFYINQFRYRLALRKACAGSIYGETRQRRPELMRQISSHLRS
jgi:capsular polysaccharide biosynthesis protein